MGTKPWQSQFYGRISDFMKNIWLLPVFAGLFACQSSIAHAQPEGRPKGEQSYASIVLKLAQTNRALYVKEPILIKVCATNLSSQSVHLFDTDGHNDFFVKIRNSFGKEVEIKQRLPASGETASRRILELKQGSVIEATVDLSNYAEIGEPGIFTVTVGRKVLIGPGKAPVVHSDPIEFTILKN